MRVPRRRVRGLVVRLLVLGVVGLASADPAAAAAQARAARRPAAVQRVRAAWEAQVRGMRLRDGASIDAGGDVLWVDEHGSMERRAIAGGARIAQWNEPGCHPIDSVLLPSLLVVTCSGGTGAQPDHWIVALEPRALAPRWRWRVGERFVMPLHVDTDLVLASVGAANGQGVLQAVGIDATSGRPRWQTDLPIPRSPCAQRVDVVAMGDAYALALCRSGVVGLARSTGRVSWSVREPELRHAIGVGDSVVAWSAESRVDGYHVATGARRFRVETDRQTAPLLVTADGNVVLAVWGRELRCVSARTGATVWTAAVAYASDAWLRGERLVLDDLADIVVLDVRTGVERARLSAPEARTVRVADDWIYALADRSVGEESLASGQLVAMRLDGAERWTATVPLSVRSPLEIGAHVYACSDAGAVYALEATTGRAVFRADIGRDASTYEPCEIRAARDGALARRAESIVLFRASDAIAGRQVVVRGRVLGEVAAAGVRVWIGDRVVRADARGRFRASVVADTSVVVQVDPRDAAARCAAADAVTALVGARGVAPVEVRLEPDGCACAPCD